MLKVKFCPKCKKNNVINVRGDNLLWRCVDCELEMAIFPEKNINENNTKQKLKKNRK